ncbi:hypothetical protein ABT297_41060 [Dactylosporangium sp. NPDC000555]|uniref:hypothetical protein n=1 Tax=Dactylosporangium sp. NPDC000555 TaxID=3154260 RepID=UPI00333235A1
MLTDPRLHREVAEAGRAAAAAYSADRHLERLLAAYRFAMDQGAASASVGASRAARTAG